MDDLKLATVEQLRQQYSDIEKFIQEYDDELPEEQFYSSAHDYMYDDEFKRQRAIYLELKERSALSEWELKYGRLWDEAYSNVSWRVPHFSDNSD